MTLTLLGQAQSTPHVISSSGERSRMSGLFLFRAIRTSRRADKVEHGAGVPANGPVRFVRDYEVEICRGEEGLALVVEEKRLHRADYDSACLQSSRLSLK